MSVLKKLLLITISYNIAIQGSVTPSSARTKLSNEEILYLTNTARSAGVTGCTLKDVENMAADKTFRHYLLSKYPDTPDVIRYRRIRDILRKLKTSDREEKKIHLS